MPTQKIIDHFFFWNLHQHTKNQAISLTFSGDIVYLKILQPDWQRAL